MTDDKGKKRTLNEGFQAVSNKNSTTGKTVSKKGFQPKGGVQSDPRNVQGGFQPTTSEGDSGPPNQGSGGSKKK